MGDKEIPRISGTLRAKYLQVPEVIWQAKGIVIMGRRLKSVLFSTDIAIIRNCNADGILAVYPFTPQQIISDAIINASSVPVLAGIGGGTTQGTRAALMAKDAEAQGAYGVVVNAPMTNDNIKLIDRIIDIPIIATVVSDKTDIDARIRAGSGYSQRFRRGKDAGACTPYQGGFSEGAYYCYRRADGRYHFGDYKGGGQHHQLYAAYFSGNLCRNDDSLSRNGRGKAGGTQAS